MYNYWAANFARDSWNGSGAPMWGKARVNYGGFAGGQAIPWDVDGDLDVDIAWTNFGALAVPSAFLVGHEFGHNLQHGLLASTYLTSGVGFHSGGGAARESNADTQAWHYVPPSVIPSGVCAPAGTAHYTRFRSVDDSVQVNKGIASCHGWLISQAAYSNWTWYGVTVTPTTRAQYDQIWYRALQLYARADDPYFNWFNDIITAAYDLYGFGSASYNAATQARDAVGGWTPMGQLVNGLQLADRYAAVGMPGLAQSPCVFFRRNSPSTRISWQCFDGASWTFGNLNDTAVDPAASEPSATIRYESGKLWAYVFWRATDNRVRYRRFDFDTRTAGPATVLTAGGGTVYASGSPSVAAVWETAAIDRLVVVYHPLANPTYFFWTYVGSPTSSCDMGVSYDSDVQPSLVSFPYPDRIYFMRGDLNSGPNPRRIRYGSYTVGTGCGGWSTPADLTALYASDTTMQGNIVRTDRGVALAEYERAFGLPQLRMTFVTYDNGSGSGVREVWYATFREQPAGTLYTDDGYYKAVPLQPLSSLSATSAGGLARGRTGYPLFHFWSHGSSTGLLRYWSTASD